MKRIFFALIAIASFAFSVAAQDGPQLEQVFNNSFVYRNLGPFRVSAWVSDIAPEGRTLRTLEGTNKVGINRVVLQLGALSFQQGAEGEIRLGPSGQPREIPPGEYDVTLQIGDKKFTQKARVLP